MIGDIDFMRSEDVEPQELEHPRLNNTREYVRQAVSAWKDGGSLPRAGGFEDQDLWLMQDCLTWMAGQNYWLYRAQHAYQQWREEEVRRNSGTG